MLALRAGMSPDWRPNPTPPESGKHPGQLDIFSSLGAALPGETELALLFARLNAEHFAQSLPEASVRWSSRMRIAGTCDTRRRVITLSRPYHAHFPEDLEDTLKHEMIHLRHPHHDADFRREAERVGTTIHCREYPGLHPRARYVYTCPCCGAKYHRARKERQLYCGRCARRRLDPRFLLVLLTDTGHRQAIQRLAARQPSHPRPAIRKRTRTRRDTSTPSLFGQ